MFLNTQHSWGIVVAKFLKTKHLSNSRAYGITTLLFVNWDKRFGVYASITHKSYILPASCIRLLSSRPHKVRISARVATLQNIKSNVSKLCKSIKYLSALFFRKREYPCRRETARVFFFVQLFHKPPVLGIALDGFADTRDKLGSVQRTVEERVDVTRLVGSRKEVVNPPKVNLWIVPS